MASFEITRTERPEPQTRTEITYAAELVGGALARCSHMGPGSTRVYTVSLPEGRGSFSAVNIPWALLDKDLAIALRAFVEQVRIEDAAHNDGVSR